MWHGNVYTSRTDRVSVVWRYKHVLGRACGLIILTLGIEGYWGSRGGVRHARGACVVSRARVRIMGLGSDATR
jgi:hypothetical protein